MSCRVLGAVVSSLFAAVQEGFHSSHTPAFPCLSQFPLFGNFAAQFCCLRSDSCPVPHCCRTSSSSEAPPEHLRMLSSLTQSYDGVRIPLLSHLPANISAAVLQSRPAFPFPTFISPAAFEVTLALPIASKVLHYVPFLLLLSISTPFH